MEKFLKKSSSTTSLSSKRPREETSPDQWKKPKKFLANPNMAAMNKDTPTNNRFDTLTVDELDTETFKAAIKKKTGNNTPPIVIEIEGEWTQQRVRDTLIKHVKDFHMKYSGRKTVRVQCYTADSHQKLKEGLLKDEVAFHTFTRKDEKRPKAVIKGLPKFVHSTIPEELAAMGFTGATTSEIKTLYPSECPPVLIQLPSGTNMGKFKQIRYLSSCSVSVERYKPTKKQGTQCFRCQGFGHASRNCNRPPRCVKCAQDHPTWECTKTDREAPAQCCNCHEAHPVNLTKCSERLKYIDRIESKRDIFRKTLAADVARSKLGAPKTWAQITANKSRHKMREEHREFIQPQPRNEDISIQEINSPVGPEAQKQTKGSHTTMKEAQLSHSAGATAPKYPHDLDTMEMLEILATIQSIKQEFSKCKTFMEKVILILTHLGHYV